MDKKKVLIIAIIFLMITPIFAQRSESGRGSRRRRSSNSVVRSDPNSREDTSWRNDLPVLPKKDTEDKGVKKEKTLEDRVKELEYQVEELERMIVILKDDIRILRELYQNSKSSSYEEVKAKKEKMRRRENMTWEERDISNSIYPHFPRLKYEGVW